MIGKGSKVEYIGSWDHPKFQEDLEYYKNIWTVIEFIDKGGDDSLVVQSMFNDTRSEDSSQRGLDIVNEKYWYMRAEDWEEIPDDNILPEELFEI